MVLLEYSDVTNEDRLKFLPFFEAQRILWAGETTGTRAEKEKEKARAWTSISIAMSTKKRQFSGEHLNTFYKSCVFSADLLKEIWTKLVKNVERNSNSTSWFAHKATKFFRERTNKPKSRKRKTEDDEAGLSKKPKIEDEIKVLDEEKVGDFNGMLNNLSFLQSTRFFARLPEDLRKNGIAEESIDQVVAALRVGGSLDTVIHAWEQVGVKPAVVKVGARMKVCFELSF
jgi:hypothetical protein